MADYQVLSQDEQDDIIISFMLAQERDKYCHELSLQRYATMLKTLGAGEWHDRISKLQAETVSRLAEVNSIIDATRAQMPPLDRIAVAKARLVAKTV